MNLIVLICTLAFLLASSPVSAGDRKVLFREDFSTLENWKPFFFPKIKSHSTYTIERDGDKPVLRAESHASASAIVYKDVFDVYEYPRAKWRWKVKNIYARADVRSKEGDDYPIRVYIMFEYDPEKAGAFERIKYGFAKALYGEYPPHSSLSYVWSSKDDPETFVISPYTDKAMMVLLEKGPAKAGIWVDEEIDILADYQKAFNSKPPARAQIAIMNDSDNTGESSVSYLEYIEVYK
jgi:Protein of unknown function (DUF3047)